MKEKKLTKGQQEFIGSVFHNNLHNSTLVVSGFIGKDTNRIARFEVTCSRCSEDGETFSSYKAELVKKEPDGFVRKCPCHCGKIKKPSSKERWEAFIGDTFETPKGGTLTVESYGGKRGTNTLFNLHCSICSLDAEMYPSGSIKSCKSGLKSGKIPCGCSNLGGYKDERQTILQITRICDDEGLKFLTLNRKETRLNRKDSFNWVCKNGHDCTTCIDNFLNAGARCRVCAYFEKENGWGFYPERSLEADRLYLLDLGGKCLKVGRTFVVTNDRRYNQIESDSGSTVTVLDVIQCSHKEVYDMEQHFVGSVGKTVYKPFQWEFKFAGSNELINYTARKDLIKQWEIFKDSHKQ